MLKKFLATVSVAAITAGAASAVEVVPSVTGFVASPPAGEPIILASDLNYEDGDVFTTPGAPGGAGEGNLSFSFFPTGGTFPTGNVLVRVVVEGAVFDGALTGDEVDSPGTEVISSDGADGGSEATFLLSDVNGCAVAGDCVIDLPLILDGSNVSVSVGLQTDAGAPIDNTSLTNLETATLALVAPAFNIAIVAEEDVTPAIGGYTGQSTFATLPSTYLALSDEGFAPGTAADEALLGWFIAEPNTVDLSATQLDRPVRVSLDGTAVSSSDVDTVNVTVVGTMDAFEDGEFTIAYSDVGADADDDIAEDSDNAYFDAGLVPVGVVADGATIIQRSDYEATVEVEVDAASLLTQGASLTAPIDSIGREGTEVTFPWTQSATQGAASGATSVFRIGNLDNGDTGAVYVEVLNTTEDGFTTGGLEKLADLIESDGEFVINSADLEAAVGNYGRGDLNFIVEADDTDLTARQFVIRNGVIQQVIGGNVSQDQN
jgi:hypothetical protein